MAGTNNPTGVDARGSNGQVRWNFSLYLGSQLLFGGCVSFALPFILLSFYVFASVAFPVVFLVVGIVMGMLVVGSVVYKVPIGLHNVAVILGGSTRGMGLGGIEIRPVSWSGDRRGSFY